MDGNYNARGLMKNPLVKDWDVMVIFDELVLIFIIQEAMKEREKKRDRRKPGARGNLILPVLETYLNAVMANLSYLISSTKKKQKKSRPP